MEDGLCQLPGCSKPIFNDGSSKHQQQGKSKAVACGRLHHFQVMCRRFCMLNPQLDHVLKPFYTLMNPHICGFEGCERESYSGHSWCSRLHYLRWFRDFHLKISPQQICRFPDCKKHVFVEISCGDDGRIHGKVRDFCGWNHCQMYYSITSLPVLDNDPTTPLQGDSYVHTHREVMKQPCEHTINYFIDSLKNYVQNMIELPKDIPVDEGFFSKHPWEVLGKPEHQSCMFITKRIFKGKVGARKRKGNRTTKDDYHWKPTGQPVDIEGGVKKRYLSYKKTAGAMESNDEPNDKRFSMMEFTIDDVEDYCVIQLYRKHSSSTSQGKKSKERLKKKMRNLNQSVLRNEGVNDSISICIQGGDNHDVGRSCLMEVGTGSNGSTPMLVEGGNDDHDVCEDVHAYSDSTSIVLQDGHNHDYYANQVVYPQIIMNPELRYYHGGECDVVKFYSHVADIENDSTSVRIPPLWCYQ